MRRLFSLLILLSGCMIAARAQYIQTTPRTWDRYPPEVQERGFGLYASKLVQMDDDPAFEEVLLFSADKGHYPYFDIFRRYYVIVDYYTKEVKYKSEITLSTDRDLILEDRDNDGKFELYRAYFQNDAFSTDESGNNLKTTWIYDRIECKH